MGFDTIEITLVDLKYGISANVEQNILTLRKSRSTVAASKLHSMWNANLLDTVEN